MTDTTFSRIPIDTITVRPQARRQFDADALQQLADSITASGLQQPLLCRREGDLLILIDGERRLRACTLLGWTEAPVLIAESDLDATETLARQLVCNLQRADLNPLEKAEGIQSLMSAGALTAEQAARSLGLSSGSVTKSLALLKLPPALLEHVGSGAIAPDTAYQLSRVTDPAEQAKLADAVVSEQLTRDGLAKRLKRQPGRRMPSASKGQRFTFPLDNRRSVVLAGQSMTIEQSIECLEHLLTRARRAKSQGLSLATFARTVRDQAARDRTPASKGVTP